MIQRIPFTAYATAVYAELAKYQTTPVYSDVPSDASKPYITIEHMTAKRDSTKVETMWTASVTLHCWSEMDGRAEINEMLNDIATVYSSVPLDMSGAGYKVLDMDVDFAEAMPEEVSGHHGVITLLATIQDIGK